MDQRSLTDIFPVIPKRKLTTEPEPQTSPNKITKKYNLLEYNNNRKNRVPSPTTETPKHYPEVWSESQYNDFQNKYTWLFAVDGKLGCKTCKDVFHLNFAGSRGVNISPQWANAQISTFGDTREKKLTSLRKKIFEHAKSQAHFEAVDILKSREDILITMTAENEEKYLDAACKIFRTAYHVAKTHRPLSDFEKIIDLQIINGLDMGLQSRAVCSDIIEHISTEMKQKIIVQIINTKSKITILVDEFTTLSTKSTLIIFIKTSIDGVIEPVIFPLDLIELEHDTAEHIKLTILKCLETYGFTTELLSEMLISFCSDGANKILGVKAGVGKLLQTDFPNIILWHCLNHKLELAVDMALDACGGTNDFKSFMNSLYILYIQSSKNSQELDVAAPELGTEIKKIGNFFSVRWIASAWRTVHAVWTSYPALAKLFLESSKDTKRDSKDRDKFRYLQHKLCSVAFTCNLGLMLDVLTELKNFDLLQDRTTTVPKADALLRLYKRRIESLKTIPGKYSTEAKNAVEENKFKNTELISKGKYEINSDQFIQSVLDVMNDRLFTTSHKSNLIEHMNVLNLDNWPDLDENPTFGENEIIELAETLQVDKHDSELGFIEYKQCTGKTIPERMKKLMLAINTLPANNADCGRGFGKMNIICTDLRSELTISQISQLIFISTTGPPTMMFNPQPYVETWLRKGRLLAISTEEMTRTEKKVDNYYNAVWKIL